MENLDIDLNLVSPGFLKAEALKLRNAIRLHRDQKGDDRCWMDDIKLYKVLPEGIANADLSLLPDEQFRRNCDLFIKNRKCSVPQGAVMGQYVMDRLRDRIGQDVVVFFMDLMGQHTLSSVLELSLLNGKLNEVVDFHFVEIDIGGHVFLTEFISSTTIIHKILSCNGDVLYDNHAVPTDMTLYPRTTPEIKALREVSFGKEVATQIYPTGSK